MPENKTEGAKASWNAGHQEAQDGMNSALHYDAAVVTLLAGPLGSRESNGHGAGRKLTAEARRAQSSELPGQTRKTGRVGEKDGWDQLVPLG